LDAHAHLLDPGRLSYGWIDRPSPALTHLLTNYYDIARDFGPAEYREAVAGSGVARVVACEFGAVDALAEARWVQECHDATGTPDAFIAAVDLTSPHLADQLGRYTGLPIVRAVRQPLYWSEDPLTRLGARPGYLTDQDWLRGFEQVADTGLVWDLLLYAEQLPQATHLAARFPEVPIVLEAAGRLARAHHRLGPVVPEAVEDHHRGGGRYLWRRSHAARASAASAVSRHCRTSSRERAYAVVKSVSKDDRASSLVARAAAGGTRL
jgi:predicted TIM-barrel fold metal-dependent hydrolase